MEAQRMKELQEPAGRIQKAPKGDTAPPSTQTHPILGAPLAIYLQVPPL